MNTLEIVKSYLEERSLDDCVLNGKELLKETQRIFNLPINVGNTIESFLDLTQDTDFPLTHQYIHQMFQYNPDNHEVGIQLDKLDEESQRKASEYLTQWIDFYDKIFSKSLRYKAMRDIIRSSDCKLSEKIKEPLFEYQLDDNGYWQVFVIGLPVVADTHLEHNIITSKEYQECVLETLIELVEKNK